MPAGATYAVRQAVIQARKLRLEEGDTGYNCWLAAKHIFLDEASAAAEGYNVDITVADGGVAELAMRAAFVASSFPLDLPDL